MKTNTRIIPWLAAMAVLLAIHYQPATLHAQGTAFTYQGQLQVNGSPASGIYNLTFSLFASNAGGVPIAGPVTNRAVNVNNGLFTAPIDFGPGVFSGATNWLEIAVQTNEAASFTTLGPRQQLTPTPYSIYAENANSLGGTLSASQLTSIGNTNGGLLNFFVGPSGNSMTSGSYNTANGYAALLDNLNGSYNTADGYAVLSDNTSGSYNTANGYAALFDNTSGSYNIALGYLAGMNISTGSSNIDIGNVGCSTDINIIRIGSGQTQTFIAGVINGNGSGLTNLNVSAAQLTSIGNTNGSVNNFFVGQSGNSTTSGSDNTANGFQALNRNTSGSLNTADGWQALYYNTSGSDSTANGALALYSNTGGNNNTASGYLALYLNTSGSYNTAGGGGALVNNTSGSNNIALGYQAGFYITTGSSNIDIGNLGQPTDNNTIRIGTSQTATYLAGTVYANGVALTSDRDAKEDIAPVNSQQVLAKVASLPVTQWNYKTDRRVEHLGPMAQDFHSAFGLNGADDKHISVIDEGGVALAAIQGLNEKLEARSQKSESQITELKAENAVLRDRLERLERLLVEKTGGRP